MREIYVKHIKGNELVITLGIINTLITCFLVYRINILADTYYRSVPYIAFFLVICWGVALVILLGFLFSSDFKRLNTTGKILLILWTPLPSLGFRAAFRSFKIENVYMKDGKYIKEISYPQYHKKLYMSNTDSHDSGYTNDSMIYDCENARS